MGWRRLYLQEGREKQLWKGVISAHKFIKQYSRDSIQDLDSKSILSHSNAGECYWQESPDPEKQTLHSAFQYTMICHHSPTQMPRVRTAGRWAALTCTTVPYQTGHLIRTTVSTIHSSKHKHCAVTLAHQLLTLLPQREPQCFSAVLWRGSDPECV